ncbi:MAG: glycoside hydrolase family 88 protein [Paludibacteraceae bacterium]|nr:glycoside hydrolase family 88 protein [Paludibacteraceae bacterium]
MRNKSYIVIGLIAFALSSCVRTDIYADEEVRQVADRVAAWQVQAFPSMDEQRYWKSTSAVSWENAVFLTALYEWAQFTGNHDWLQWCTYIADTCNYTLPNHHRIYHADNFVIGLMYAEMFRSTHDSACLAPTKAVLSHIMDNPPTGTYDMDGSLTDKDHWTWCDALYMAPPTYAAFAVLMGDTALMDLCHREFEGTYDALYNPSDSLFYRDATYFPKREKNGCPVYWGRGNSWVMGGLARLLTVLPATDPRYDWYVSLYREMMAKIVSLQDENGFWHASMLDPDSYPNPETSSTGLFAYALWWGINAGILDEATYLQPAQKAWQAMVKAVHPDGMLGFVQPVGADPQSVTADMTETYGAGAFLMTAQQILIYNNHKQ